MAETTGISWSDSTWSPWGGCQAVSLACDHCYAEALDKRTGHANRWGPHGTRESRVDAYYQQPLRWNAKAAKTGQPHRVFPSMCDPFDNHHSITDAMRARFWETIRATRALTWLLLTKRPQNIAKMLPPDWGDGWPNVWLGCTAENQEEADRRIPHLLRVAAVLHFVSYEPALGPVNLRNIEVGNGIFLDALTGYHSCAIALRNMESVLDGSLSALPILPVPTRSVDWCIVGGESGPNARPMHPDWARSVRDQCAAAGAAFHFKQWGEWAPYKVIPGADLGGLTRAGRVVLVNREHHTDAELCVRSAFPGCKYMERVGKSRAGHLLDGREHKAFPHV